MVSMCPPLDGSAETETTMPTSPKTLDFRFDTFTEGDITHEVVGVRWDEVTGLLGRPHDGSPEDDQALTRALVAAGAPAWVASASGAIDESGWYLLGPEAAEPLLDSELEDFNGDHVVLDDFTYAVDTEEQIAAVGRMLLRLDASVLPVFRGAAPDTIKTTLVVVPRA
jgi:hypothetical protein